MNKSIPFLLVLLFIITCPSFVLSNEKVQVTENDLQERIKIVEDSKTLDDDSKKTLVKLYTKSLNYLESIKNNSEKIRQLEISRENAPAEIKETRKKIQEIEDIKVRKLTLERYLQNLQSLSIDELQQKLNSEKANLAAASSNNNDIKQRLDSTDNNPTEIRKRI